MAKIILALWFSSIAIALSAAAFAAAAPGDLPALVKAWRAVPTPARRAAVESYAAAHARDSQEPLAELALGIGAYEQKDYPAAIAALRKANVPKLADYVAFYLGAARVESNDAAVSAADFAAVHSAEVSSPLEAKAWLEGARAYQASKPSEAAAILQAHHERLPEPEGDLLLADCYRAAGDLPQAARYDQRVYDRYISGDAANRASAALAALRQTMGAAYPLPSAADRLERADRLLAARDSARARLEYEEIARDAQGLDRDEARVRMGEADLAGGQASAAARYLNSLEGLQPEADAERLYYLTECARRMSDDAALTDAVHRLGRYPRSPWYLKALAGAGSHFLAANQPVDYVPIYQTALENFPDTAAAGLYHWRIAFHAYLADAPDAADLLRDHLTRYPEDESAGAALYFLGRLEERRNDFGAARTCYLRITGAFENHYYSILARERLAQPELAAAQPDPAIARFLEGIALKHPDPISTDPTADTAARIARSRLLRSAGLGDLADAELRFGARNGGQPVLLGMEIAGAADAAHQGVHIMKLLAPEYLDLSFSDAPRKFWELLFPLPYRSPLTLYAHQHDLDPYLLAGLIRQESEFDPQALSHANAYGLTQVLPSTGRLYAGKVGIQRFSSRMLWEPDTNLRIGSSILRGMLDRNGGHVEQTLAAYNAGPNRAAQWVGWNQYREPAEFVESIPYNETRSYVQAVLRNADIYRRLYSDPAASPAKSVAAPVKSAAAPVK